MPVGPPRRKFSRRRFNQGLTGYLFALPWLLGFVGFTLWPMLYSLYTSFTRYNIIGSPREGTIKKIMVGQGDTVDKKQLLLEFE